MTIKISKEQSYDYKESKEYLDRQQNIDALIALARIAETVRPTTLLDAKLVKIIDSTLDKL